MYLLWHSRARAMAASRVEKSSTSSPVLSMTPYPTGSLAVPRIATISHGPVNSRIAVLRSIKPVQFMGDAPLDRERNRVVLHRICEVGRVAAVAVFRVRDRAFHFV